MPQLTLLQPEQAVDWRICAYSGEGNHGKEVFALDGFWIAFAHRDEAVVFVRGGGRLPRLRSRVVPCGCLSPLHLFARTWRVLGSAGLSAFALGWLTGVPLVALYAWLAVVGGARWPAVGRDDGAALCHFAGF